MAETQNGEGASLGKVSSDFVSHHADEPYSDLEISKSQAAFEAVAYEWTKQNKNIDPAKDQTAHEGPVNSHELTESPINQELRSVFREAVGVLIEAGFADPDRDVPNWETFSLPGDGTLVLEFISSGYDVTSKRWITEPLIKIVEARSEESSPSRGRKFLGKLGFKREERQELEIAPNGTGIYRRYRPDNSASLATQEADVKDMVVAEVRGSKNIRPELLVSSAKSMVDGAAKIVKASKLA